MKKTLTLELPWPPSVNHYYRRVGNKTLISKEGRKYRQRVAMCMAGKIKDPLDCQLEVSIDACPPDKRRRDIDNIQKALLDALEKCEVYKDDSQIVRLTTEKMAPTKGGSVTVRITESGVGDGS